MRYFPILQEMFESDAIFFLGIGILAGILTGIWGKGKKKVLMGAFGALALYGICEICSNFHTNFLAELLLLFIGAVALGCAAGLSAYGVYALFRKQNG